MSGSISKIIPLYLQIFDWKFRDQYGAPLIHWLMAQENNSVTFDDYTLFLNPDDKTANELFLTHVSARDWIWEAQQIALFRETIAANEGCLVLDIGANYGAYSLSACKLAVKGLVDGIVALEPNKNTYSCLKKSIEFNHFGDFIHLVNSAVSDVHNVQLTFFADPKYSAMSKRLSAEDLERDSREGMTYQINGVQMDSLLEDLGIDKNNKFIIKIDVEGSEPSAFRGLQQTLQKSKGYQVFFEFHPDALNSMQNDPQTLAEYVFSLNPDYVAEIDHHNRVLKPIKDVVDFSRIIDECVNPTRMWADFTNIFFSKGLELPASIK